MGLFDAFGDLFARGELPDGAPSPVRVSFVGTVASPNDFASPVTGTKTALAVFTLLERILHTTGSGSVGGSTESESFRAVGSVALGGPLVVADGRGRQVSIPPAVDAWGRLAIEIVSLGSGGIVIENRLPAGVEHLVRYASGLHMLFYRETLFRQGDRVRVRATVTEHQAIVASGYRDGVTRTLVARPDLAPLTLVEMI